MFRDPVHIGELVTFEASVNRTWRTSMEVGIRVTAENILERTTRHTNSSYVTMVALGEDKTPVVVPPLAPRPSEQQRRWEEADVRRASGRKGL